MKRNCNLELRLVTPSVYSRSLEYVNGQFDSVLDMNRMGDSPNEEEEQQQQMTIFYGGKIATCDANELQARVIFLLANEEMKKNSTPSSGSTTPSPSIMSPGYSPSNGLYMKKSLQRFLQKRKNRSVATSPYPTTQDHQAN